MLRPTLSLAVCLGAAVACARRGAAPPADSGAAPRAEAIAGAPDRAAPEHPPPARGSEPESVAPPAVPTSLPVPGSDPAVVSLPASRSGEALPLFVAAHGAGDDPASMCAVFRALLENRGLLLCLAGPRVAVHSEGRYFPDHHALERLLVASVDALVEAAPRAVDRTAAVYAGYSQGATMGALMIAAHGDAFPRLLLVEGGFDAWTPSHASEFRKRGGRRVLFACGRSYCRTRAESAARVLERAGVEARVVSDLRGGHTYRGAVAEAVAPALDWLLAGDPRWQRR
jgi:predicted esterase